MKHLLSSLLVLPALLVCSVFAQGPELGIHAGYRVDRGQWTIAGPNDDPNIISDLEWEDLNVFELRADGSIPVGSFVVLPALAIGVINDGENRDSDYAFSNREGEFSRSTADTEGQSYDLEVALGYPVEHEGFRFMPQIGVAYHVQNLEDTNGEQIVDRPDLEAALDGVPTNLGPDDGFLGPFEGLDSTYDAEWLSFFLGVAAELDLGERTRIEGRYRFHLVDYSADLYWNLRDLSFTNDAEGAGHELQATLVHELSDTLAIRGGVNIFLFETDDGTQSDPSGPIKLNGAEWESVGFFLGVLLSL